MKTSQVTILCLPTWRQRVVSVRFSEEKQKPESLVALGESSNHAYCRDTGDQYKQTNGMYEPTGRKIPVETIRREIIARQPQVPGMYSD